MGGPGGSGLVCPAAPSDKWLTSQVAHLLGSPGPEGSRGGVSGPMELPDIFRTENVVRHHLRGHRLRTTRP